MLDQFELPKLPDNPDTPLAPWLHYGIMRAAGIKIRTELERIEHPGYMIGLGLSYTVADHETIAMQFGQDDDDDYPDSKLPLDDDFLANLYDSVNQIVTKNVRGEVDTELSVSISGSRYRVRIACRLVLQGECQHVTDHTDTRRICKSRDGGITWTCLEIPC
jgi:hypothetical protein